MIRVTMICVTMIAAALLSGPAAAADLYSRSNWSALASDRRPSAPGDILTILIYQNASASNDVSTGSNKNNALSGQITAGSSFKKSGSLSYGGSTDNKGTTGRSGQMVAQMSAVVDQVLENGDLQISGLQNLNINRERTTIRLRGRVRPADISADNVVLSSRIAEAAIDYNGSGFVSRSGRPGIVARLFNFLGLM